MKKNYSDKWWILPLMLLLLVFSCTQKSTNTTETTHQHGNKTQYTCPMHPQIIRDEPGSCPICGMDLVPVSSSTELHLDSSILPLLKPVNERIISSVNAITPESGSRIFTVPVQGIVTYDTRKQESISSRVAGRIEKMYIKYNYQQVRKGQLIMEIYSPDLAAAQRELIYISQSDNDASLLQRAKQRLSLLGMQPAQINHVLKTGKPLYRVPVYSPVSGYIVEKKVVTGAMPGSSMSYPAGASSGGMSAMGSDVASANISTTAQAINPTPVIIREGQYVSAGETVFTIYKDNGLVAEFSFAPSLSAGLKPGQRLLYHTVAHPDDMKTGTVGLIEPRQQKGASFTTARVYLSATDLKPGQLLIAFMPVVNRGSYWLPQDAVLQLGNKAMVFKKENNAFVPLQVQTGIHANGMVEIKENIADWQVAKNAGMLVDAESIIRPDSNQLK